MDNAAAPAMDSALLARLKMALPAEAIVQGEALAGRTEDWLHQRPVRAQLLLRPGTTAEVSAALKLCHGAGQPVIVHAGLSGLVHGADTTPSDIVLSLQCLNSIKHATLFYLQHKSRMPEIGRAHV